MSKSQNPVTTIGGSRSQILLFLQIAAKLLMGSLQTGRLKHVRARQTIVLNCVYLVWQYCSTTCEFCCVGNIDNSDNARIYGQVETFFGAIRNVNCIYEFMREKQANILKLIFDSLGQIERATYYQLCCIVICSKISKWIFADSKIS